MGSRITSSSVRPSYNANAVPVAANNAAPATNAPSLSTADAVSLTTNEAGPVTLDEIAALVMQLEQRISALEVQVAKMGAALQAPANNTPVVTAVTNNAANNAPANNIPANNAPANNVPAGNDPSANGPVLPPGMKLPPFPGTKPAITVTNNAPANNIPANNTPVTNGIGDSAIAAQGSVEDQLKALRAGLQDLQSSVGKRIGELDAVLRTTNATATAQAERSQLDQQAAGLQAVSHVLKGAKLTNLSPEEEKVVKPALARVHEIGAAIGKGENPNAYAAELYVLKYTLQDPAGAGQHKLVTGAAQVVGLINEHKTELQGKLTKLEALEAKGKLSPAQKQQKEAITAHLKSLIGMEKALDGAKLTGLDAAAEKRATEALNKLGDLAEACIAGKLDPAAAEDQIFKLGQVLKNPKATAEASSVQAGGSLIKQIGDAKSAIHERLRAIDDKVMAGEPADTYAAERTRLLDRAEALNEVSQVLNGVRLDQSSPAGRKIVTEGLKKAEAIVAGLAQGDSPEKHRAELFVLKQTFQEPLPSRDNAAIQSGAAALQMIATAEARNAKQREAIASKITRGEDARQFDAELAKLNRQHEDLEAIRHTIEGADYGGLTTEQENRGAKLIDQMRDIAMKVASGEDFGKLAKDFKALAADLADLRHWQPSAPTTPAPTKPTTPAPTTPTPPSSTSKPAPTTPTKPAPKGPEPGGMYQVKSGDYLTRIAREKLGDPARFKEIVELNKEKYPSLVKNPDLIYPGWTLVLPK